MPTATHQVLLLWLARKMTWDGFRIAGYEGPSAQGGIWNELPRPPIVGGVRPDVWGYDASMTHVALGEAKTAKDIDTEHTRAQLRVFRRLRSRSSKLPCRLYVAVPRSAAQRLDRVLAEMGLVGDTGIVRLHVPEMLIGAEEAA